MKNHLLPSILAAIVCAVMLCGCSSGHPPKSGTPAPSPQSDFRFYTPEPDDTLPPTQRDTLRPAATPSPVDDYDE